MVIKVKFKLTEQTLQYAIASLMMFGSLKMTRRNILDSVRNAVEESGTSIITFPEYWGDDIMSFYADNQLEVDRLVKRYSDLIER